VFDAFGTDRLMFGSDWPVCLLVASYAQVKQVIEDYMHACTAVQKENVFGGNAIQFYNLKEFANGLTA
jgi:L-fuconolactonase